MRVLEARVERRVSSSLTIRTKEKSGEPLNNAQTV